MLLDCAHFFTPQQHLIISTAATTAITAILGALSAAAAFGGYYFTKRLRVGKSWHQ